jgi:hypothetical protein
MNYLSDGLDRIDGATPDPPKDWAQFREAGNASVVEVAGTKLKV